LAEAVSTIRPTISEMRAHSRLGNVVISEVSGAHNVVQIRSDPDGNLRLYQQISAD
jgi:hypothetical protein